MSSFGSGSKIPPPHEKVVGWQKGDSKIQDETFPAAVILPWQNSCLILFQANPVARVSPRLEALDCPLVGTATTTGQGDKWPRAGLLVEANKPQGHVGRAMGNVAQGEVCGRAETSCISRVFLSRLSDKGEVSAITPAS